MRDGPIASEKVLEVESTLPWLLVVRVCLWWRCGGWGHHVSVCL